MLKLLCIHKFSLKLESTLFSSNLNFLIHSACWSFFLSATKFPSLIFLMVTVLFIGYYCFRYFFWFVLLGDFHVNINNPSNPLLPRMLDCLLLVQVVTEPTHINHTGHPSPIDLVLISNPSTLSSCSVIPPLASSDHIEIHLSMNWKFSNYCKLTKQHNIFEDTIKLTLNCQN